MSEDSKALEAAKLYAEDATFQHIAETLEISKSHAQVLVRRGILLSMEEPKESEPSEPLKDNPGIHQVIEEQTIPREMPTFPINPNIRQPELFTLETSGVPKRIVLTPYALMIFDIWRGDGFEGDLSDFLEKAVIDLYNTRRPMDRSFG